MMNIEEITAYRTEDGEYFDSYEDAKRHAVKADVANIKNEELIALTLDGREVPVEEIFFKMEDIFYISIRSSNALEFMREVFASEGYDCFLESVGDYRYDIDLDKWRNKEKEVKELTENWWVLSHC